MNYERIFLALFVFIAWLLVSLVLHGVKNMLILLMLGILGLVILKSAEIV